MHQFANGTSVVVAECDRSSETAYFWFREAVDVRGKFSCFHWTPYHLIISCGWHTCVSSGRLSFFVASRRHHPLVSWAISTGRC